jgi:hypothetical protein
VVPGLQSAARAQVWTRFDIPTTPIINTCGVLLASCTSHTRGGPPEAAPAAAVLSGIANGPDGNLWFTTSALEVNSYQVGAIGRIAPSGSIKQFARLAITVNPVAIAAGPDGNLWLSVDTLDDVGNPIRSSTRTSGRLVRIVPWLADLGAQPR